MSLAQRFGIQTERIVGEIALRVGENPAKLLYGRREVRVTASLIRRRTLLGIDHNLS
jgi:hypothetical protein